MMLMLIFTGAYASDPDRPDHTVDREAVTDRVFLDSHRFVYAEDCCLLPERR